MPSGHSCTWSNSPCEGRFPIMKQSDCYSIRRNLCSAWAAIKRPTRSISALLLLAFCLSAGCNFVPDLRHKVQYHNPFPQISKVAVLPFRNQSQEPTLSGARVSMAYYNELQSIRGFEVLPFGVVENELANFEMHVLRHPMLTSEDFQNFARHLGVDAVLQGSVTDYTPYYPPRLTLKVNWYAANPGFHPIPVGYGLPWGTKKEKKIPEWIRLESERSLASKQLETQTPIENAEENDSATPSKDDSPVTSPIQAASHVNQSNVHEQESEVEPHRIIVEDAPEALEGAEMPANWPDPQGFIPKPPSATPPKMRVQYEPIISHMHTYNGNDEDFTQALQEYFYFRDDARFGGWQSYLQRSEDFIRFCCYQHIVETLGSRGGQLESRMILRWPINRYDR